MIVCVTEGRREGGRDGGRDGRREGRTESGGMAAKKLEPHTEMWGKTTSIDLPPSYDRPPSRPRPLPIVPWVDSPFGRSANSLPWRRSPVDRRSPGKPRSKGHDDVLSVMRSDTKYVRWYKQRHAKPWLWSRIVATCISRPKKKLQYHHAPDVPGKATTSNARTTRC